MEIVISKSINKNKKFDANINGTKHISCGDSNYSDFTKHKDKERTYAYINHHKTNEDWTKSGVTAAGWMSKHVLWNKPTLQASVADINKKLKSLNIKMK